MFTNLYTYDELYMILSTIIEYNLDLQRKQELFTEKMTELKGLFGKLSYEELRQISFDNPLSLTSPKKGKTKKNDQVPEAAPVVEMEEVKTPQEVKTTEQPVMGKIIDEPVGEIKEIKMSDLGPIAELDEE